MVVDIDQEKNRLRKFLNPSIKGSNVDKVLESLASGSSTLINNVSAVNDQLYIISATENYLDQKLADYNLTRPENVGLADEIFKSIGIEVTNRKQVRDLIHSILEVMYGYEFTRTMLNSPILEPYSLEHGDNLIVQFDDGESVDISFLSTQFTNINSASAQEVADVITKTISRLGRSGSAVAKDDGLGGYVSLLSETKGPSSSIRVVGGKAQNVLKFDEIRPTSANASTEWTLSPVSGGGIRATWTDGGNPSIGKVSKGDYINIYGTAFNILNRGTFTITAIQGGSVGTAYIEFDNPSGIAEPPVLQGSNDAVLFFYPKREILSGKREFAACFQTESRLLEIFIPAATKVVRRERRGSAHLYVSGSSIDEDYGAYIFDTQQTFAIGGEECTTTVQVDSSTELLVEVDDSSEFPNEQGYVIFGYGTNRQEKVPYISRPSNTSLLINPNYQFTYTHPIGTNISLVVQNYNINIENDGSDYAFYLTDIVSGRIYTQDLINTVVASGINVVITVLYPNPEGLENWTKTEIEDQTWRDLWNE